jgi:hypothetical protein
VLHQHLIDGPIRMRGDDGLFDRWGVTFQREDF